MLQNESKKEKGVYRAKVVDVSFCAVVAVLSNKNEIPTLYYMPQEKVTQKDIRQGDWLEMKGDKILRVLKEKRGAENDEETKGIKNPL